MPDFIMWSLLAILIYYMALPFINLIDEYNEKKEAEEKEKEYLAQDEDFNWDWLEEIVEKENSYEMEKKNRTNY